MKWIKFNHDNQNIFGVLDGDMIHAQPHSLDDVLAGRPLKKRSGRVGLADVKTLNPIGRPGKIICIGLNYADHVRETGATRPERPVIFSKFSSCAIDPGAVIEWSASLTQQVDYEAELAVVIGRTARRVGIDDALDYVGGYTCANDVSARDLQLGDGQWIRGKNLDTFCPLGPVLVTPDSIADPQALAIRCELNGETVQDSNTSELIFGVAEIVSFCSQAFTLEPGDVILTGTPSGVGLGRTPPLWMKDGDVVAIEIEGIGRLENPCRVTA
jgi:2-keto-4-pentenoate hydratase/2-oxohepta-3-ene-1,7-dioic acid hydratase in catechol pathway